MSARFELQLDEETRCALQRLSQADSRSNAGTIRHLIRGEAQRRGLWNPSRPQVVSSSKKAST